MFNNPVVKTIPFFTEQSFMEICVSVLGKSPYCAGFSVCVYGVFTMVDKRTNFTKDIIAMIENAYGENIRIFKDHIPHSVRAAEASATGKSIFTHDPNGKVAAAYAAFTGEVLNCG